MVVILLPVAETKITQQYSTFLVVCSLKSYLFTVTSVSSGLSLPDYPMVKVTTIPENAVRATEQLHVIVKERLSFDKQLCGKILLIDLECSCDFTDDLLPPEQAKGKRKTKTC